MNGRCTYNGERRAMVIVYQVICICCNYQYIGVTQQTFKDRMAGHFALLNRYMRKHKDSSSLVKHLAQKDHWPELAQGEIPTPKQLWAKLIFNVVY